MERIHTFKGPNLLSYVWHFCILQLSLRVCLRELSAHLFSLCMASRSFPGSSLAQAQTPRLPGSLTKSRVASGSAVCFSVFWLDYSVSRGQGHGLCHRYVLSLTSCLEQARTQRTLLQQCMKWSGNGHRHAFMLVSPSDTTLKDRVLLWNPFQSPSCHTFLDVSPVDLETQQKKK